MIKATCRMCPKLIECELEPEECNRNQLISDFLIVEVLEIIKDLHRVFTEIEDDGDE